MKYSFKRDKMVDTVGWSKICNEMQDTLEAVIRGEYTEEELAEYFRQAVRDGEPLRKNPEMIIWGFDAPENMPADARCEYFYRPTYLIVQTMIAGINRFPDLMNVSGIRDTLARRLYGCTGRGLSGSGYEGMCILLENLQMFTFAGVKAFLAKYPDVCPKFGTMFTELIGHVRDSYNKGEHIFDWERDFTKEQKDLLSIFDSAM